MSDATKPKEFKFTVHKEQDGIGIVWDGDFGLPLESRKYHVIEYGPYLIAVENWTKFEDMYWFQRESLDIEIERNKELRLQNEKFKAALTQIANEQFSDDDEREAPFIAREALAPNQDKEKME